MWTVDAVSPRGAWCYCNAGCHGSVSRAESALGSLATSPLLAEQWHTSPNYPLKMPDAIGHSLTYSTAAHRLPLPRQSAVPDGSSRKNTGRASGTQITCLTSAAPAWLERVSERLAATVRESGRVLWLSEMWGCHCFVKMRIPVGRDS